MACDCLRIVGNDCVRAV